MKGKHNIALLLLSATAFAGSAHAQEGGDNPFAFKAPKPKVVETTHIPVVDTNPDLSDKQTEQVEMMMLDLLKAMKDQEEATDETVKSAELDGKHFVLLDNSDRYVGISSGMYVVFSESVNDYEYHDTQKYSGVMQRSRYQELRSNSRENLFKAAEETVKSFATKDSGDDVSEQPPKNTIKVTPAKID